MTKRAKRWQIWKIALTTAGCAVLAVALFWLSAITDKPVVEQPDEPVPQARGLNPSSFMMMMAVLATGLTALSLFWLSARLWELRKPAWERGKKKKR